MPGSAATPSPRLALTMGDVAGIGPEIVARVAVDLPELLVVGDPRVLERALELVGADRPVCEVAGPREDVATGAIGCWNPSDVAVDDRPPSTVDARCGQAAVDWLLAAAEAAGAGHVEAIVTAPLHKTALAAAGIPEPGHTELLGKACGVERVAMMLYLPPSPGRPAGLGVAHVTLHTSLASVPGLLSVERIGERIELLNTFLKRLDCPAPRIAVCALNPHAGENGLFGNEEAETITPAVNAAARAGIDVAGPLPADTLLQRAVSGEFDGVVAMYHDQGHIALKLAGLESAINITLGLPIIRTSPSHGTAFDIAWQGIADESGLRAAIDAAVRLCRSRS